MNRFTWVGPTQCGPATVIAGYRTTATSITGTGAVAAWGHAVPEVVVVVTPRDRHAWHADGSPCDLRALRSERPELDTLLTNLEQPG